MKLPKDMPFVLLDRNMYGTQESSRLTEDFIEWLVRDCAKTVLETYKQFPIGSERPSPNECANAILCRYGLDENPHTGKSKELSGISG